MGNNQDRLTRYARKVHEDSQRFTKDLLAENEKLRGLVASLECSRAGLETEVWTLRDEVERYRSEHGVLQQRLSTIEEENGHFLERYFEIEQQVSNLANLYAASYRLHGTMDRAEVLAIIQEIIINLVGSEELTVFELDPNGAHLRLIASFGLDPEAYRMISLGAGVIGAVAQTGEILVREQHQELPLLPEESSLTVCIPLKLQGKVTGVIAVFRLLSHKAGLEAIDQELFDLLGTHAATALYSTALHARKNGHAELVV